MPITPTYPGVYVQEIASGVRTITGVATSITAFIGRALRGPTDTPVTINSYADFERTFGGLWVDSTLGYAVRDFYLNGGGQAIIVRLYNPYFVNDAERDNALAAAQAVAKAANDKEPEGSDDKAKAQSVASAARTKAKDYTIEPEKTAANVVATAAESEAQKSNATAVSVRKAAEETVAIAAPITKARLIVDTLNLEASSAGAWGNNLRARVDSNVKPDDPALFNLAVKDDRTGQIEYFRNLSVDSKHPRRIDKVLLHESGLVRLAGDLPGTRPKGSNPPQAGKDVWDDNSSGKVSEKGSDGNSLMDAEFTGPGKEGAKQGIYALEQADLFNLLCIPPYTADGKVDPSLISDAAVYCEKRRAMFLFDAPWVKKEDAKTGIDKVGTTSKNAAIFFPRLRQPNPLRENQIEDFSSCGAVAGVFARTDAQRGIWKAPAGLDATLVGVPQLSVSLTDAENGELNPLGINCLRSLPAVGRVVWGARTLQGDDRLASEWKYIPVRRLALYIEESLYRGTQWVVFEPNDEPLWAQIRLNLGAFMHNLFRQGAFQGKSPREAYFVKCDSETTTQNDINLGIVNIVVGFAPLKPAEFVIISLQQMAGQIEA